MNFNEESNRTVWPPFRVVGSPTHIVPPVSAFVKPEYPVSALFIVEFVTVAQTQPPNFYIPSYKSSKTHLEIIAKI